MQMEVSENSQLVWVKHTPFIDSSTSILIKYVLISHDRE